MARVGLQRRRGGPDVGSAVRDALDNWVERYDVVRWASEKDKSHGAGGGGLLATPCQLFRFPFGVRTATYVPGDGEWLSSRHNLIQTGLRDGIARRIGTHWLSVGVAESRK